MWNQNRAYSKSYNRIKDGKLLERVRQQSCLICGRQQPSDPHHIKSVGSGGHDTESNVVPLCRQHHTEIHSKGLNRMSASHGALSIWLSKHGWSYNPLNNKWVQESGVGGVII